MGRRMIGLARDALLLNLGRSLPFRVTLMVSEECPLHCATCSIWRTPEPRQPGLSDLESFFRANRQISWLNLTGGEIFLRRDMGALFESAAKLLERLAVLNFPTAGQDPDYIASQVETGLSAGLPRILVTVSFDGGRRTHDRLRGFEGAFDRAARTWRNLEKLATHSRGRLSVFAGMTLSAELLAVVEDPLDELVVDLGLESTSAIHLNLAHASDHYYRNTPTVPLPHDAVGRVLRKAAAGRRDHGGRNRRSIDLLERIYLGCAHDYLATGRSPLPCKALRGSVFVDAGLDVYPCTIFPVRLGNLRDCGFSLAALRRTPLWRETAARIAADRCPGCWTPCEAYPAAIGNLLGPGIIKIVRSLTGNGRAGS